MDMDKKKKRERGQGVWARKFPMFLLSAAMIAVVAASGGEAGAQPEPTPTSAMALKEKAPASQKIVWGGEEEEEPEQEKEEDWRLILVNRWNPMPEDYEVTLAELDSNHAVDERCYDDLQAMLADCRKAGLRPVICSSYRTNETQQRLYKAKVKKFRGKGYNQKRAEEEAGKIVAVPGTSEHQLGLAVDIVDKSHQVLDKSQERTKVQKWLIEHCWEYGFILRYPNDKSEITGIIYEPWHYRYVGKEAAKEITEQGVCLEEYLEAQSKT